MPCAAIFAAHAGAALEWAFSYIGALVPAAQMSVYKWRIESAFKPICFDYFLFQLLFRFSNNRINMYMMINQYLDHIESGYPRILFIMSS